MEKWRGAEREEAGGGDIFLMREPKENRSYIYEEGNPNIYASYGSLTSWYGSGFSTCIIKLRIWI
jgi:hypothetical protein